MNSIDAKRKTLNSMLEYIRKNNPMQEKVITAMTDKELKDLGAFQKYGSWWFNHPFKDGDDWGHKRFELIPRAA